MYLLRRLLPPLLSISVFLVFFLLIFQPHWLLSRFELGQFSSGFIRVTFSLVFALLVFTIYQISRGQLLTTKLRFLAFPLLTFLSAFSILLFSDYGPLLYFVAFIVPLILWIWLESLYLLWQQPQSYQAYTLQSLSNYLYLITIFLFIVAATGIQVLFQAPFWLTAVVVALVFWLLQVDQLVLYKIKFPESALFAILGTFLGMQLFFVLNLLPTHFFLYGLFISLFFYSWLGIGRQLLQRNMTISKSMPYVIISLSGFFITFFTSLWIS